MSRTGVCACLVTGTMSRRLSTMGFADVTTLATNPLHPSSASPSFSLRQVGKERKKERAHRGLLLSFWVSGVSLRGREEGKYMIYGDSGIVRRNAKKSPEAVERLNFPHPLREHHAHKEKEREPRKRERSRRDNNSEEKQFVVTCC